MMMQCPRCSTRWRVAAAAPVENPLFKCGKCHHLFRQFPGATPAPEHAPAPTRRARASREADTLEFIFPERQSAELLVAEDPPEIPVGVPVPAASPSPAVESPPPVIITRAPDQDFPVARAASDATDEDAAAAAREAAGAPTVPEARSDAAGDDASILDGLDDGEHGADEDEDGAADEAALFAMADEGRRLPVEETMRAPSGFGTIMRAIGTAVTGFVALALVVRVAPERTLAWLSRLPLAGATFARDRNLAAKVELTNVQGRFQRLRNDRRVFIITGDARNNSPVTIERIEVSGALYGLGGGELDQKVVATGNRTALTDLSEAEIVLLQRLDPVIALAPGASTPFAIVFLEPPRELREFSSRVLSVRPTRRASSPPAGSSRDSVG